VQNFDRVCLILRFIHKLYPTIDTNTKTYMHEKFFIQFKLAANCSKRYCSVESLINTTIFGPNIMVSFQIYFIIIILNYFVTHLHEHIFFTNFFASDKSGLRLTMKYCPSRTLVSGSGLLPLTKRYWLTSSSLFRHFSSGTRYFRERISHQGRRPRIESHTVSTFRSKFGVKFIL